MDEAALKAELKDVEELLKDLTLKVGLVLKPPRLNLILSHSQHEDMKASPETQNVETTGTEKALDEMLQFQFKPTLPPPELPPQMDGPVNDLSKLVKKKKKPAAQPEAESAPNENGVGGKGKRKVEEAEDESSPKEKKAKLAAE